MKFKVGDIVRLDSDPMDWIGYVTTVVRPGSGDGYPQIRWILLYGGQTAPHAIACGYKAEAVRLYDRV